MPSAKRRAPRELPPTPASARCKPCWIDSSLASFACGSKAPRAAHSMTGTRQATLSAAAAKRAEPALEPRTELAKEVLGLALSLVTVDAHAARRVRPPSARLPSPPNRVHRGRARASKSEPDA